MEERDGTADAGAHHGEPPLTVRDVSLLEAMVKWIATAREATEKFGRPGYPPEWLPSHVDILKSRLFWRIRSGKEPLPEPPPCAYSCPWYELIEEPERAHWTHDFWVDPQRDICAFAQAAYDVIEWGDGRMPKVIGFGSYRFNVWAGEEEVGSIAGGVAHRVKIPGHWIQLIRSSEAA